MTKDELKTYIGVAVDVFVDGINRQVPLSVGVDNEFFLRVPSEARSGWMPAEYYLTDEDVEAIILPYPATTPMRLFASFELRSTASGLERGDG